MPPICWHMVTASDAVSLVKDPLLKRYSGAFLLGSTAPDIRIMTNVPREETHFYDLSKEDAESGLSRMLAVSPHLARAEDLTEATRAFVSGYLTHLAVDEMWICQIYRPFFGKGSPLGGDPDADVLDRVLQFEMDLRERHNRELMDSIRSQIDSGGFDDDLGFIQVSAVNQWRERVSRLADREPSWTAFRDLARRYFGVGEDPKAEDEEKLMARIPDLLERSLEYITTERLAAFREEAVARSAAVVGEYLG